MSPLKPRMTMNQTYFPEDVFRLIKSFTKPKPELWVCDSCDDLNDMKEEKPQYIDGFELSVEPAEGFVPICQECIGRRKCSMCWGLACVWKECNECEETYCEDCFDGAAECPNCFEDNWDCSNCGGAEGTIEREATGEYWCETCVEQFD